MSKRPSKPRELKGEAAAEWRRVLAHLDELKVQPRPGDRAALVRHCEAWERYRGRLAQLGELEDVGPPPPPPPGSDSEEIQRYARATAAYLASVDRLEKQAERWARELERTTKLLGLAPSTRSVSRDNNTTAGEKQDARESGAIDLLRRRQQRASRA